MQGEVTRTTSASARDMGTLLAESQRQSQEAATARLDAIDRAGAARQRAATMPCWLSCRCWKPA